MKKTHRRLTRICYELDLPPEALAGAFCVRIIENCYAMIENYVRISELKDEIIRIQTENGEVAVHGERLTVEAMLENKLCIRGVLHGLEYK